MKFLLTSAGITNKTIAKAIVDLVGKPAGEIRVIFIPTAANLIEGDKGWLIENYHEFYEQKYATVDILEVSGATEKEWRPRVETADLICFGGGNEQHLAKVLRDSGLGKALPELLKTRLYMGISAGSMVAGQFLSQMVMKIVYPEEVYEELAPPLGLVDCHIVPHLNSRFFVHARKEKLEPLKSDLSHPLYAIDDASAVKIVDGKIETIGEGEVVVVVNK